MVWGCNSASGAGNLVKVYGIMKAEKCHWFLIHHAIPSGKHLAGNDFFLKHDNDPKHTASVEKHTWMYEKKTA